MTIVTSEKDAKYAHTAAKLADANSEFLNNLTSNTGYFTFSSIATKMANVINPKTVKITPNVSFNIVNP